VMIIVPFLLFCCFQIVISSAFSAPPPKPVWPTQFDCLFGLSIEPNVSALSPAIVNSTAHFYYSYPLAQLIQYPNTCIPGLLPGHDWTQGCSLLFNSNGTYIYNKDICCLVFPGVGVVPPDFLAGFNYSGFVLPAADRFGVLHSSVMWTTPMEEGGFFYWTDAHNGDDVAFVDGDVIMWNFDQFNVRPQPSSLFKLPSDCLSTCPTAPDTEDPMVRLSIMSMQNRRR